MSDDPLFIPTPRTDGAKVVGDNASGNPETGGYNSRTPVPQPVVRPPTLGDIGAPAKIVGDQVTGSPDVDDDTPQPAVPPIKRVADTRTQLPRGER